MSSQNIPVNDIQFQRGRQSAIDSSSSRDSSPKRKRGLTPASDDDEVEEIVLPATALLDETPPPPDRPLVREPVAFSSVAVANVTTYQAAFPLSSSGSQTKYLPGQDPSTTKTKKKRTKRVAPFSSQTGRFRLQAYDHGSSARNSAEPLQQGQGPYHSLYRAGSNGTPTPADPGILSGTNTHQTHSLSSQPPSKRARHSTQQEDLTSDIFNSSLLTMPDPMFTSLESVPVHYPGDFQLAGNGGSLSELMTEPLQATPITSSTQSSNASTVRRTDTGHGKNPERTQNGTRVFVKLLNALNSADKAGTDLPAKRTGYHNRLITILIHDMRNQELDHQLAEVNIPVKMADNPQNGFWADAKDIIEKLQSGPSRIDGPARVFTLRGKYRQIFLRVSAENDDHFRSANIIISADRTLDIVVETLPEAGSLPPAPRIPTELLSSPDMSDLSEECSGGKNNQKEKAAQTRRKHGGQKRQYSSSDVDSSDHGSGARGKQSRPKRAPQKKSKGSKGKGTVALSALASHSNPTKNSSATFEQIRGYESPSTDEDPNRLYDLIVRAVEIVIQRQPDGLAYTSWRSGTLPELIKACGFVQRTMDELVGEWAPFRSKNYEIKKTHILAALRIEPKMADECSEILKLLRLYGENGVRGHDGRVSEMIARRDPKPYKQLKQLLRLLRSIHDEWKRNHGAGQSDTLVE